LKEFRAVGRCAGRDEAWDEVGTFYAIDSTRFAHRIWVAEQTGR